MTLALSLAAEGIRRHYRRSGFTLDVDRIEVPAGSALALLGPSGSGKTTLLHLLGLLERPDEGRVLLDGREVSRHDRSARLLMAAVLQRPYLFRASVADNVAYGLVARSVPAPERARLVSAVLERVGLAGFEGRSAGSLSGGEAQRVSLARALVLEPRVLLLDEPLASLDPMLKRRLTRDFAAILSESDATVVWVTHDQDEALVVADRVAIMNGGRVVAEGPADEVTGLPGDAWTAAFLGMEEPQCGRVLASVDGLVEMESAGVRVAVAGEASLGARAVFTVRPEDVLLFDADADLPATTARNRLHARVVSVQPRGATVHVVLDAGGIRLGSSVSRAAAAELRLAAGARVLAVFKATAARWRVAAADGDDAGSTMVVHPATPIRLSG